MASTMQNKQSLLFQVEQFHQPALNSKLSDDPKCKYILYYWKTIQHVECYKTTLEIYCIQVNSLELNYGHMV